MTDTTDGVPPARTPDQAGARWRLFVHRLGGDLVAVETADQDVAGDALAGLLGVEAGGLGEDVCCCGPAWSEREGPLADGSWPGRPGEDVLGMGPRFGGAPRARYVTAAQLSVLG